jgi:hypothetical protein
LIEKDEMSVLFKGTVDKHLTKIHWKMWRKFLWRARDDFCKCEISFYYCGQYEDACLLGCCAV